MTAISETKHAGCFMASDSNGTLSRDVATVKSGQVLVAGEVVQWDGGVENTTLIAATGVGASDGDLAIEVAGIIWDNVDASGGAVAGCVYVNKDAEVKLDALTFPTESTDGGERAATIRSLRLLGIKPR
jgi:hypothetical protein